MQCLRTRAAKARGRQSCRNYLFHLSDGEDLFIDDKGKQLEDSGAAHLHALRIIEKVHRLIPDAANSRWKIRITLATGQSVMTVISPALGQAPSKAFGKRSIMREGTGAIGSGEPRYS